MQHREAQSKKEITFSEFKAYVQNYHDTKFAAATNMLLMTDLLNELGCSFQLTEIDFGLLPMNLYKCITEGIEFIGIQFERCKLPRDATFGRCIFVDCDFIDYGFKCDTTNSLFFINKGSSIEYLKKKGFDKNSGNLFFEAPNCNPIIGVVYFQTHGTSYTDKIIDVLNIHSFTILKMNENILLHPLIDHMSFLDGIVLPGGGDVITDPAHYSQREKLESLLVTTALRHKIPTLGVCRGHQFIGHYFGAEVKSVPNHSANTIHVLRDSDSLLYALTEKKYTSQTRKRKRCEIEKEEDGFKFKSHCVHGQGLFFKELPPPEKKFKITAKADDGLPESLQVGDNIISFQHHHEVDQSTSTAKAALRLFVTMVIDFHEKKQSIATSAFTL